jgi:AAA+ ATPase superfamily predicted ATPase
MDFYDRKKEIELLNDIYNRSGAQFVVLYGRRRIGKTSLITHWLNHNIKATSIYRVAHKSSSEMLPEKFSRVVRPNIPNMDVEFRFKDWDSALRQVVYSAEHRRIILAIDEFPYLLEAVPEISSIMQMIWDQLGGKSKIILILSGSHYHMMFKEFSSGKGPLYGRSTAELLLEEIDFPDIGLFLPRYSPVQLVETYSVIGGVPKYLEMWEDRKTIFKNIEDIILSPVTIFRQEAIFLIQDEISEPRTYLAILEDIGNGTKTPSMI